MPIQYNESLDLTFHALGDGTRRGMLAMLATRGEHTAGELGKPFGISQPSASQHLRVLERAGLLERHVEGRIHRFSLKTEALQEAQSWIGRHREFWKGSLDRLHAYLENLDTKDDDR
jgi:DNA-binding transcriptional ArsR family regulator